MTCISYRQSVNSKTIKSVTMLSQSGFWLKSVQSETSECSTLPRHVSHWCHDSQVVINHLQNRISHYFKNIVVHTILVCQCINKFMPDGFCAISY